MLIGVIGAAGVVGSAVVKVIGNSHTVFGKDPAFGAKWAPNNTYIWSKKDSCWYPDAMNGDPFSNGLDAVFICVPTPWNAEREEFDSTHIDSCMRELIDEGFDGLVILKSTVLPTVIAESFWRNQLRIVACPEFLNARSAYEDLRDADHIVIGGNLEDRTLCLEIHKQAQPGIRGYFLNTPEEAMMLKYMKNTYFAAKNALFNQFYDFCSMFEWDYNAICSGLVLDDRIHPVHTDVPGYDGKRGYGGACLPKDVKSLAHVMKDSTFATPEECLLQNVDRYNESLKKDTGASDG